MFGSSVGVNWEVLLTSDVSWRDENVKQAVNGYTSLRYPAAGWTSGFQPFSDSELKLHLCLSLCFQSLDGFVFALNKEGRFLYISETVSIYLGLSQVSHTPVCLSVRSLYLSVKQKHEWSFWQLRHKILVSYKFSSLSSLPFLSVSLSFPPSLSPIITKDNSQQIKAHLKSHQLDGRLLICAASDDANFIAVCVSVSVCVCVLGMGGHFIVLCQLGNEFCVSIGSLSTSSC